MSASIPPNFIPTSDGGFTHPSRLRQNGPKQHAVAPPTHPGEAGSTKTPPKRIRQSTKPLMNKLEGEFKVYYEAMTGHELVPQSLRFMLGNGIWYKPDFVLWCPTMGMKCLEIKGPHSFRGGFENLKVAASKYPKVSWELFWKQDGKWEHQNVYP